MRIGHRCNHPIRRGSQRERADAPDESLTPLCAVARNLWWSWDPGARRLFESIDPALWARCGNNPLLLLRRLSQRRRRELACDRVFLSQARSAVRRLQAYLRAPTWYRQRHGSAARGCIAYFSMEFGLHESLPIFAGGLGVLAGDHFKSASDLGLPLVGVGIFWRHGYTRQGINTRGRQTDRSDRLSPDDLPLTEAKTGAGRPIRIRVPIDHEKIVARAWRVDVGRTPIFLLDTNLPQNAPRHRKLTDRLYSGDCDTRIRQEMILGIGGWRLLQALDLPAKVKVCHLNEGHAAFCSLERIAETRRRVKCDFDEAARRVSATTVFTTHTPVPDGNETFSPELIERYLHRYCRPLGLDMPGLLALGRANPREAREDFGMTPLALRLSARRNGVSRLHGEVSRQMWRSLWPKRQTARVPIGSITNGIHLRTWLHPAMGDLLDAFLPEDWEARQDQPAVWAAARKIPDARLWETHLALKRELIDFVNRRLRAGRAAGHALEPEALTIGFARRFAIYKRAALIFSDPRRLARLVNHSKRPVQLVFAGKAHPADESGKALVAEVVRHARSRRFRGRVVFLENYDMEVARHMVAGVDVWLNNPQRPREASGTSGMKPALHGGLNLSILDGWWPEACVDGVNGWAIGRNDNHNDSPAADRRDARTLYQRLQRDVIPLYYRRNKSERPTGWLRCMKTTLATIPSAFNSHRMVKEYLRRYYLSALRSG